MISLHVHPLVLQTTAQNTKTRPPPQPSSMMSFQREEMLVRAQVWTIYIIGFVEGQDSRKT